VIFGVGTDIAEVARVGQTFERFGEHFVDRLLMDEERPLFERSK
jgi:phosphopantetheinyl transferase (holo-ACP synthase)